MNIINESSKQILKIYLEMAEPEYVKNLNIRYDMEYFDLLAVKLLDNKESLNIKIENISLDMKNKIEEYINRNNNLEDKIHFMLTEIVILIANKYYNEDGTLKED